MIGFEPQYYFFLALSYFLVRPVATIFHELGHLLILLMLQKGKVRMFIGSRGQGKGAWNFQIGRLLISFHPAAFLMRGSLCDYDEVLSYKQLFLYNLMGPLFSLLGGLAAGAFILKSEQIAALEGIFLLLGIICIIDFLHSLFHKYDFVVLANRQVTANDGQILKLISQFGSMSTSYLSGQWAFLHDYYAEAYLEFAKIIAASKENLEVLELQSYCAFRLGKILEGLEIYAKMESRFPPRQLDYHHLALLHFANRDMNSAMESLERGLQIAPGNFLCLNEKAHFMIQKRDFNSASIWIEKALIALPDYALAYTNRAWLNIQKQNWAAAAKDLEKAMKEDAENAFLHRNFVALHLGKQDLQAAAQSLITAKLLGLPESDFQHWKTQLENAKSPN